jgi:multidrug efflux system membrane fusion protein
MARLCALVGAISLTIAWPAWAQQGPSGVPVSVAVVKKQDVPIFTRGIGTVQALQSVLVRARVDGTVERIAFTEGQDVKPGDLLAVIDPRPYQAVYDQALAKRAADTAMLGNAKRDLARYADLAKSDFASRQSVDTQQASVSQTTATTQADDAAVAAAKLNLDFTKIVSPTEGRVGLRLVDQGNLVHANDATGIVTVNQIHPISALFTLPQDVFPTVQDSMRASHDPLKVIAFSSNDKEQLSEGTLLTMDNTIDTSTGTIKLKAQFGNRDDRLWPGQFINVHLQLGVARDAVTVPSPAIQRGVNGLYVYVVKSGSVASLVPVEAGQDDGKITIITKGLTGTETVVTGGQSRLTDGTRVAINTQQSGNGTATPAKVGG